MDSIYCMFLRSNGASPFKNKKRLFKIPLLLKIFCIISLFYCIICIDVCLIVTITPVSEVECGFSSSIATNGNAITLPLVACFSITLNDDLSVRTTLTRLSFKTS